MAHLLRRKLQGHAAREQASREAMPKLVKTDVPNTCSFARSHHRQLHCIFIPASATFSGEQQIVVCSIADQGQEKFHCISLEVNVSRVTRFTLFDTNCFLRSVEIPDAQSSQFT